MIFKQLLENEKNEIARNCAVFDTTVIALLHRVDFHCHAATS